MAAIVPGFATRHAPGSLPFDFVPALGFKVKNRQHPAYRRVADQF
jgi:hypothetical protein